MFFFFIFDFPFFLFLFFLMYVTNAIIIYRIFTCVISLSFFFFFLLSFTLVFFGFYLKKKRKERIRNSNPFCNSVFQFYISLVRLIDEEHGL
jgi:hypothetical protein